MRVKLAFFEGRPRFTCQDMAEPSSTSSGSRTLRIASSTTIRSAVTSCLAHLRQGTDAGPIVLHTHSNATEGNSKTAKNGKGSQKTGHAAISKLFSVVEIVKREFEEYQRAAWRTEAAAARLEQTARELRLPLKVDKGKGRAVGPDVGETVAGADPNTATRPKRSILRVYQYNELDYLERPGRNISLLPGDAEGASGTKDGQPTGATENTGLADGLVSLDKAIEDHVVKGRKRYARLPSNRCRITLRWIFRSRRPLKCHTPTMRITLTTVRLAVLERQLTKEGKSWTMQAPPNFTRSRKRKRRKVGQSAREDNGDADDMDEDEQEDNGETAHRQKANNADDKQSPAKSVRSEAQTTGESVGTDARMQETLVQRTSASTTVPPRSIADKPPTNQMQQNSRKRKTCDDDDADAAETNAKEAAPVQLEPIASQAQQPGHPLDSQISHVSESTAITESSIDKPLMTALESLSQ